MVLGELLAIENGITIVPEIGDLRFAEFAGLLETGDVLPGRREEGL